MHAHDARTRRKVVYFDDDYRGVWIKKKASEEIRDFLERKEFSAVNANELLKWMNRSISSKLSHETVVVFSIDVFPKTVFYNNTPNIIVRKYLDAGGRIVWMGDVPFWYCGIPYISPEQKHRAAPFTSILGLSPIFVFAPYEMVEFTEEGKKIKLTEPWFGIRPMASKAMYRHPIRIIQKSPRPKSLANLPKGLSIRALACSKAIAARRFLKRVGFKERLGRISAGFAGLNVGVAIKPGDERLIEWNKEYVNAWILNFNEKFPSQGFIRIWDYPLPKTLPEEMLIDMLNVAKYNLQGS